MQFIGIKDINNVEIFEGDILIRKNSYVHTVKEYWEPIYKVQWNKIGFELIHIGGGKDPGSWYLPLTNWKEMEIIGNIFENKDFLKNNDKKV